MKTNLIALIAVSRGTLEEKSAVRYVVGMIMGSMQERGNVHLGAHQIRMMMLAAILQQTVYTIVYVIVVVGQFVHHGIRMQ
jgi:hypothetical protein